MTQGLYHADGQIQHEVYVYGSFLQSARHRAGVTCSDCHDPHSAEPQPLGTTRYGYVYAVALHSDGQLEGALRVLKAIHERHPGNVEMLYALATFNRDAGRATTARK